MADNFTSIFGGRPESSDAEQPASNINNRPEEDEGGATAQGFQEEDSAEVAPAAMIAPDNDDLGAPSGSPEPYGDGGF